MSQAMARSTFPASRRARGRYPWSVPMSAMDVDGGTRAATFSSRSVSFTVLSSYQKKPGQSPASILHWWAHQDSNLGPDGYEPSALTN